jgi:hypothetical protein
VAYFGQYPHAKAAREGLAITRTRIGEPAGSITRFFEPFEHLHCGDGPFWQMRIERARGDVWRVDQFRSREFLGLSLTRECFRRPCERVLSPWHFK